MTSLGSFSLLVSLLQATRNVTAVVAANKRAEIAFFMILTVFQDKEINFAENLNRNTVHVNATVLSGGNCGVLL